MSKWKHYQFEKIITDEHPQDCECASCCRSFGESDPDEEESCES